MRQYLGSLMQRSSSYSDAAKFAFDWHPCQGRKVSAMWSYLNDLRTLVDVGATSREVQAWLLEQGVHVHQDNVARFLRKHCGYRRRGGNQYTGVRNFSTG